jgi:hypothetical protein
MLKSGGEAAYFITSRAEIAIHLKAHRLMSINQSKCKPETEMERAVVLVPLRVGVESIVEPDRPDR